MPSDTAPHPDQRGVEPHPERPRNINGEVEYAPNPAQSKALSPARQSIMKRIIELYCGHPSEEAMSVYKEVSIYDDPFSYCSTRYQIAGQWYGIPKLFAKSETLATEVVEDSEDQLVWKQRQKYTFTGVHLSYTADSLISLKLEKVDSGEEKVVYHKDMWNEKDYSHKGLGATIKKLQGWDFIQTQSSESGCILLTPEKERSLRTSPSHPSRYENLYSDWSMLEMHAAVKRGSSYRPISRIETPKMAFT